ncbi:pyruvate formate-lyase [Vibrio sp. 10N.286.49.C2]|uniref:pyruvate formate lyase family protein n=1 Tax=unclassified Vibrio TaxID=2614977 RepID=UPI000C842C2F|nr:MULTISPECIES: pyruvate formate lyase family protein [unclassified Vibrio]PMH26442.1 pyruvate formate-lyase [Vibrio sp. 10N.286.49.C2]PMH54834.1 pyruvate formate-lyase [Vibrio sp. 10N.286.49.B1]PMH82090.1 pyruvate formate-lyase [Vibrio sp. 10N.286.48.B7]
MSSKITNNPSQVDVNKKIPCEKGVEHQLSIMESYTRAHQSEPDIYLREAKCLAELYPVLFRQIEADDSVIGRIDALPIGFGSVTSVGGVGHYCNFSKLEELKLELPTIMHGRIDALLEYWEKHDTRSIYFKETITDTTLGKFVDVNYPAIATARLSGMYLDYNKLIDLGLNGMKELNADKLKTARAINDNKAVSLHQAFLNCLAIVENVIDKHVELCAKELASTEDLTRKHQMNDLIDALMHIRNNKPATFLEGIQLTWLYSMCSGVVNYGRMDDYLGDLLVADLAENRITERQAINYIRSHYRLIEARKTTVNGRVVIGGLGRINPESADIYCRLAIQAVRENKDTEPQFTLRIHKGMNQDVYQDALDAIGEGLTYPILYNDDVNVPAVMKSMQISEQDAQHYVPFGCGEFVLSGKSVGTPNTCINILKILNIALAGGVDFWDGQNKAGDALLLAPKEVNSFDDVMSNYKILLDFYIDITSKAQAFSYEVMNQQVGFLFTSMLTDDCIGRSKALLDGGVYKLGGTNETYGNTNAYDSLAAIKKVIFDDGKYSYTELIDALEVDFDGYDRMKYDLIHAPKFGNDDAYVDDIAIEMHEYICNGIKDSAAKVGMDSYLVVIINNQVNTEWGRATSASADGRHKGVYMSNANNPQSGADKNGPTAMLNSLAKLKANVHAGSVQNMKFSKNMYLGKRMIIESLLDGYFDQGGPQIMVSVVGKGELEDAYHNPEKYPNLVVRVGGFSARFVNLDKDVQLEILNRTLND